MLDEPATVSRIVFRHGISTEEGGWFDTSQNKPRVEAVLCAPPCKEGSNCLDMTKAKWESIAQLDDYPSSDASVIPHLGNGQLFEILLPKAIRIYALRILGRPARDYASCAELGAYR